MRLQNLLHRMRLHAEFGRHQRGDPRRPVDPGVALLARQAEHHRRGAGAIDQFALHALQPQPREMCLGDLVRGARLNEGDVAARRQTLFLQRLADRADRGFGDRASVPLGFAAVLRGIARPGPGGIGLGRIDRAVRLKGNAACLDGAQNRDMADAALARIAAD